jgi:hypothetical protein
MTRRGFLTAAMPLTAGRPAARYFSAVKASGRWWFRTPEGEYFFSLGMNHIDSATLRYRESGDAWKAKYGNSERTWIERAVVPDLKRWGFNTIGWAQEVVVRMPTIHRHSPPWTYEHYQWAGMPYCHLLPFAELHQWEYETRYPDFFSKDFEEWCDYVARHSCARMAEDPKLIGYFYTDCPTWVHTQNQKMKGPIFDPKKLESAAGRQELSELAGRYYKVTHDAIRRYDPNHLIMGDRYEGRAPLPDEVLRAAMPYVDVFCFQYFDQPQKVTSDFLRWHELTGKPVLLADAARRKLEGPQTVAGTYYQEMLRALRETAGCVGFHYCGAYLTNRARRFGLRSEQGTEDTTLTAMLREANQETEKWVAATAR